MAHAEDDLFPLLVKLLRGIERLQFGLGQRPQFEFRGDFLVPGLEIGLLGQLVVDIGIGNLHTDQRIVERLVLPLLRSGLALMLHFVDDRYQGQCIGQTLERSGIAAHRETCDFGEGLGQSRIIELRIGEELDLAQGIDQKRIDVVRGHGHREGQLDDLVEK